MLYDGDSNYRLPNACYVIYTKQTYWLKTAMTVLINYDNQILQSWHIIMTTGGVGVAFRKKYCGV